MGRTATDPGQAGAARRRDALVLAGILVLGLAVRLLYLHQIRDHPLFLTLTGDPRIYFAQSRDILAGKLTPDHPFFHSSPLYPFFLALVARLGGSGLHAVRVVQSLVGTLSVGLVFVLGRLTVGRRAGLIAALFAAVYVPFVFFEAEFLEITLVLAFLLGSLVLLASAGGRPNVRRALAAGALLGAAGLGKPNLLLFAPVAAVWIAVEAGGAPEGPASGGTRRSPKSARRGLRLAPAVLFFVAAGAVVLPATIHNYRTEGGFIPVSSNGGINFYIGNHANSPGVFQVPPELRFDLRVSSKVAAERAEGRELTAAEVSNFWARAALREIRYRPGRWFALMGRKFVLFWNHYEIPNHYHLEYVKGVAPVLRLPAGTFAVVAPLGLVGLALALRRRRTATLLVTFGLTFMASVLPFFVTGRYRLAVAIVLLVGAGAAVDELWTMTGARRWKSAGLTLIAVAVLAAAVNVDTIEFGFAHMHNAVGAMLGGRGDIEGAAREFRKAVAESPNDVTSRYNLGLALLELERPGEAALEFEAAVRGHRGYHEAWIGLGRARAALGDPEGALEALANVVGASPAAAPQALSEARGLAAALLTEIEGDAGTGSE